MYVCVCVLPQWLSGKESACSTGATGDVGSIPGSGRFPGGEHGYPLQYSFLENPMDKGAWRATVHRVTKSWTRVKWLSTHTLIYIYTHILNCKEIKPDNPEGNQSQILIGRMDAEAEAPMLWPPDVKNWLIRKTLMLGKTEGRRRRGQQRMRWLDGITDSIDMS